MNLKRIANPIIFILFMVSCQPGESELNGSSDLDSTTVVTQYFDYLHYGDSLSKEAQAVIKNNLLTALGNGGSVYAIGFCNTNAIHLTDSMAMELNVQLQRVSDKVRNPMNQASDDQQKFIQEQQLNLNQGLPVNSKLNEHEGKMVGYYPILTNAMCLQCHGTKGETMTAETYQKIMELYPNDSATGYVSDQVRGLWVVTMDKQ